MKGDLHCLARMSTNFHEFFTFGNNLRFLPKFPFKCSKNPLSRTLYDVYDDVPDYSRLKQEIHTMSINSWVLETFFSVIQKNWRNQRFFRLLIFEQLNYWAVFDVPNQNKNWPKLSVRKRSKMTLNVKNKIFSFIFCQFTRKIWKTITFTEKWRKIEKVEKLLSATKLRKSRNLMFIFLSFPDFKNFPPIIHFVKFFNIFYSVHFVQFVIFFGFLTFSKSSFVHCAIFFKLSNFSNFVHFVQLSDLVQFCPICIYSVLSNFSFLFIFQFCPDF